MSEPTEELIRADLKECLRLMRCVDQLNDMQRFGVLTPEAMMKSYQELSAKWDAMLAKYPEASS